MATEKTKSGDGGLADLVALYQQLGTISATLFAPLARTYVGTLAERSKDPLTPGGVVNLALRKLAFETGEMLVANNPPTAEPIPVFKYSEDGRLPDLSLAYVAAAALAVIKRREQRTAEAQAASASKAPVSVNLSAGTLRAMRASARTSAYAMSAPALAAAPPTVRMTGGCGCGGGSSVTPPPPPGGSCGCSACEAQAPATDPTAPAVCPPFISVSCATQTRLRDCIKTLACDLLAFVETRLCADVAADSPAVILCNFLKCVRDAICPAPAQPCLPAPALPCLPCGYAVENS